MLNIISMKNTYEVGLRLYHSTSEPRCHYGSSESLTGVLFFDFRTQKVTGEWRVFASQPLTSTNVYTDYRQQWLTGRTGLPALKSRSMRTPAWSRLWAKGGSVSGQRLLRWPGTEPPLTLPSTGPRSSIPFTRFITFKKQIHASHVVMSFRIIPAIWRSRMGVSWSWIYSGHSCIMVMDVFWSWMYSGHGCILVMDVFWSWM